MKKKIEIEFDNEDRNGFTEVQLEEMNKLMLTYILRMQEWSSPKKVTIDGNVFWIRTENKTPKVAAGKKYPVHHEDPIVMNRPKLTYPKGKR